MKIPIKVYEKIDAWTVGRTYHVRFHMRAGQTVIENIGGDTYAVYTIGAK